MSTARTAAEAADAVFVLLQSFMCLIRRSRPRPGRMLAAVGAHLARFQMSDNSPLLTGIAENDWRCAPR